jgi:hypothetical protein
MAYQKLLDDFIPDREDVKISPANPLPESNVSKKFEGTMTKNYISEIARAGSIYGPSTNRYASLRYYGNGVY